VDGKFDAELVPVAIPQKKSEPLTVAADEGPRADSSLESLGRLKPVFQADGTVTAGNASPLNDGASALVLMEAGEAKRRGLRALATFVAGASAGVDPNYMGIGPVPATRKALAKAGLASGDVDLVELNEAFAAQSVACMRELALGEEKVNVNGGAIALGHPLGSSGSRLICSLTHEMNRSGAEVGLATMCIGVGQGIASIWRRG
jgi:acetyl-CoA acetyltransferase family protein